MPNIAAANYLGAHMFNAMLFSPAAGQAFLLAGLCMAALALVGIVYRGLATQYRQLTTAVDNMSQGLNVFDGRGRITLLNRRYLEMYKLSPDIVKPGCTLQRLLQHRKDTGIFKGEVEPYCRKILDDAARGKPMSHYVQASDGRIVLAKNEPLPGGGWVSTHEDVTEQRHAEEERAAIRGKSSGARPSTRPLSRSAHRSRSCSRA